MDGFYFYWLVWVFFVIAFFFLNDRNLREKLAFLLLTVIILAETVVNIFSLQISGSAIFLLLSSYFYMRKVNNIRIVYYYLLVSIVTLSYAAFHLFALYDPAWLIFNKKIMLIVLLCYIIMTLTVYFKLQLILLVSGVIQGDILYSFILAQFQIPYIIGDYFVLDTLVVSVGCLFTIFLMKKLSTNLEQYFKQSEGGKRRLL